MIIYGYKFKNITGARQFNRTGIVRGTGTLFVPLSERTGTGNCT
jgi:hypothetical protein